ncbi:hypothetical protein WBP07_17865 [Novosphingobium sp. BL-8A]|uniref:hypothetical protein n=1 Tax=Novosphingobium sp. BL-8A TaxID=3127639 RepID=UPI0037567521
MRTERLDLRIFRNATYQEGWQISDTHRNPIDLTGCTLALSIRAVAGQGPVLAAGIIDVYDAVGGSFNVTINGSSLDAVAGQSEVVRLAYDLRLSYADGVPAIPVSGQIILTPGVTY